MRCARSSSVLPPDKTGKRPSSSSEFDYLCPAFRFPKFFHARRAWMENDEWLVANLIGTMEAASLFAAAGSSSSGSLADAEIPSGCNKGEIVIRRVHLFHRTIDELVVKTRADFGFDFQSIGHDPSRRRRTKTLSQAERSLRVKSTTQSKPARRISIHAERSRTPRFVRNVCRNPWMAGRSGAHSPETARAICAAGNVHAGPKSPGLLI